MVPDDLTVTVAVLSMAALTLFVASLYTTYQRAQAYKRMKIQQILIKIGEEEAVLSHLLAVALPRDVRLAIRQDILHRYRRIRGLHRKFKDIDHLLEDSEQRLSSEGADAGAQLPVPSNQAVFEQWQHGFHDLMLLLQPGGLSTPMASAQRQLLVQHVLERQAECFFGHFMNQADKHKGAENRTAARGQIQQLIDWLRALGVRTERIQALLSQAEEAYQYLKQAPATEAPEAESEAKSEKATAKVG